MILHWKLVPPSCCRVLPIALLAALAVISLDGNVHAQRVQIDITEPTFQRVPIAIPDFKHQTGEQAQLARDMAATLGKDLDYSGVFRALDPRAFLEDPQSMGLTAADIKFQDWRRIGADFLVRASYQVQGSSIKIEARLFDVVANRMGLGKIYEGDILGWRAMVHRFADEILFALTGERGVFDTRIAFVQSNGKVKEIYVVDFDGGNPIQVTHDQGLDLSPAWSPQGDELAYVSYKEGNAKIFVLNLTNRSSRLLCGYPGINISPEWRPGSRELAATLSQGGNPDIYLVSSSGGIIQRLVQSWAIDVSPSWAPDGRRLAFVSDESGSPQIYVLDIGSGRKQRITFSGNYNTSPSWSPKGDWIAYSGLAGGHHNIFIVRPDGGDVRQLTHGEGNNESPTWSPDGRMLAFSSTRQGGSAIWVLLTNGTGVRRLTQTGSGQELPDWSPRLNVR
jgi:TolB protein